MLVQAFTEPSRRATDIKIRLRNYTRCSVPVYRGKTNNKGFFDVAGVVDFFLEYDRVLFRHNASYTVKMKNPEQWLDCLGKYDMK